MPKGKIDVQTENIFPIIKKFLYSEQEIFLREIISNAIDATQKLKTLHAKGKFKGDIGDETIEVKLDKDNGTITVSDHGVGMTEEEVKKYINQVAFSSAQEFLDKYKDKDAKDMIGHFGLGFYSVFMVADRATIVTKSYQKKAKAVQWECEGTPEYKTKKAKKKERGTDVILHMGEEGKSYLDADKIKGILNRYCKFLPIPIKFEDEQINNPEPAWTKHPNELTPQNYKDFYNELYPYGESPLFWIHLNVDYPFELTGILYFPKVKNTMELKENKIQLYANQVYVTDKVEDIVPEFLRLLHGVIDSPDIPLNVSRSYLQGDPRVKKINSYITKKVAEKLQELFKKDREDYESKWEDISIFIKYGMMSDDKFFKRAKKFCLLQDIDNNYFTIDEFKDKVKDQQTDKDDNIVLLYATNPKDQHTYIQAAQKKNYKVLQFDGPIDTHFINHLEQQLENVSFTRVDADTIDNLVDKGKEKKSDLSENQQKQMKELLQKQINNDSVEVKFDALSKDDQPLMITKPEFNRRMKDMAATSGMSQMQNLPEQYNVVVNTNHPLITKILLETDEAKRQKKVQQAYDLARLSQNMLKGEALSKFMKRSVDMLS